MVICTAHSFSGERSVAAVEPDPRDDLEHLGSGNTRL